MNSHRRVISAILLALSLLFAGDAFAFTELETSEGVLMFKDYIPAVVELHNGKFSHQRQANIFLKNSSLVYKQGGNVMQARMDIIRHVVIDGRVFCCVGNRLAEIVDSCGPNKLLRIKTIDLDALEHYRLNETSVTNFEIGDNISVTRLDGDASAYPLATTYYFLLAGKEGKEAEQKVVECHERQVTRILSKKQKVQYRILTGDGFWSWSNEEALMKMLKMLSE